MCIANYLGGDVLFEPSHTTAKVSALIDTLIDLPTNPPSLYIGIKGVLDTLAATAQSQFSNYTSIRHAPLTSLTSTPLAPKPPPHVAHTATRIHLRVSKYPNFPRRPK